MKRSEDTTIETKVIEDQVENKGKSLNVYLMTAVILSLEIILYSTK